MTEKTEEQIDRERKAVSSMSSAKANMELALGRIVTLEQALRGASVALVRVKKYIPENAYQFRSEEKCTAYCDNEIAAIVKVLS